MKYGFFDSKYDFQALGYGDPNRWPSEKLTPKQFIVMGVIFVLIIIGSVLLRLTKKKNVFTIYKVLSIVMPLLEIFKISFETYHDLNHGQQFNLGGILPLYACSMLLYFLPFVAWGKGGKMQKWSMAFFASIGMICGLSNFVYLSAVGWYPILSFGGFYSIFFHAVIVFVGVSLLITGIYTPSFKTIYEGMIPILMFSVIVIPANFIIKNVPGNGFVDYMMLMDANGFIPTISHFFTDNNIQILFSLLMLLVAYPIATAIITLIDIGINELVKLANRKRAPKEPVTQA